MYFSLLFCFFSCIPIEIASSAIELKTCKIAAGIKRYKLIIEKEKKKHDNIILLAKCKLNNIEVKVSEALIDSINSHDEFVLINSVKK